MELNRVTIEDYESIIAFYDDVTDGTPAMKQYARCMKRTVLFLLFALLLVNCGNQPQTLSELKSEYITIDDSICVHYKIWNESAGADAKTICFVHGYGCEMNTWEKQFEAFLDDKDLRLVFIDLPVMVICTQNSGLKPDNKQKMQRLYPNLDYTELTTCGHFIHMEQSDMFNEKLKAFIASQMSYKQADDAHILFEIRPEVNYVTHLYTLAGLGFSDEEYVTRYGNTLPKAAVDTLQKYKDYLTFGQGEGGMLAGTFFFMVSADTFANADSLQNVMDKYQEMAKSYNSPADIMNIANAIAKVYVDNYDNYLKTVYPQAKKDMEERQNQLSQHMQDKSFVKDWEHVTGYQWHRGDYHWLLYRAGAKGPSYNNLDKNTNTVYYNQSLDYQLSMFSHEFGIFLMQDSIDPIVEEMKEYARNSEQSSPTRSLSLNSKKDMTFVPWSAFESLACWYNCKIAGKETEDYRNFSEADVKTFCQIYDRLSATGITSPAELYRKGIMEYLK